MDVHNREGSRQNGPGLPKARSQITPSSTSQNLCVEVLAQIAHAFTRFDPLGAHTCTRKPECTRVATFTQLASGNWRVQARPVMWRRRSDGARTAKNGRSRWSATLTAMDRPSHSAVRNVRTFGDLIDLHDEDMREVG